MKELVSVIIPTYKRSTCLIRAINSVLFQTYANIEIIVVDDNDKDSIYRKENEIKLKEYIAQKRIIYVKHEKNMNGASARNTGIKNSKGSYITFLDDDDYFLPNRIEKMVKLLNKNKTYDGAYSSVIFEDKEGHITNLLHAQSKGNMQKNVLCEKSFFGTGSNMFFRKSVIDKIGLFDENFKRHQDLEYMVRFFEFSEMLNIDEFLVVKSNFDNQNKPNYQLLYESKEKFLKKFEIIINSFNENSRREIYVNNLNVLYNYAPLKEKKYIMSKLKSFGENRLMVYIKSFKINVKLTLKRIKVIKVLYMFIIGGRKYNLLLKEIKKTIE